jgi:hypothetical protein
MSLCSRPILWDDLHVTPDDAVASLAEFVATRSEFSEEDIYDAMSKAGIPYLGSHELVAEALVAVLASGLNFSTRANPDVHPIRSSHVRGCATNCRCPYEVSRSTASAARISALIRFGPARHPSADRDFILLRERRDSIR